MGNDPIFLTEDGSHSVLSEQFGVSYHSKYGAVQESLHVFINAGLKHYVAKSGVTDLSILEMGFGTGLNAYLAYLEAQTSELQVAYTAYEKYPLSIEQVQTLNYPQFLNADTTAFTQMHDAPWGEERPLSNRFSLTKIEADFSEMADRDKYDVIFFDAFAPQAQPELWEAPLFEKMFNALKVGGILTTYCAKGSVKRCLKSIGFALEAIPGPPGKREMTRATKPTAEALTKLQ